MRRLLGGMLIASVLPGCGVIHDRSQEYEVAKAIPRIEVPAELQADPMRNLLVVPDIGTAAIRTKRKFTVPRPDFFYAEAGNDKVNLTRSEIGKMIVVDEPVAQVWSEVEAFWAYNEIAVAVNDPQRGVMETDWITDENSRPGFFTQMLSTLTFSEVKGPYRDKIRARIASAEGRSPGQTAIQLQHVRAPAQQDQVDWSAEGADVSYKSEIMYDLLHFLSKATEKSTAKALAERTRDDARAYLGRDSNGTPVLKLTSDVDRSWAMIEQALAAAQIDVGSSNRELGKYYITYTTTLALEPQKRIGSIGEFFDWLHGDREEISIATPGLKSAFGIDEDDANAVRYSAKPVPPKTEQQRMKDSDGYKIWIGEQVIYVFGGSDGRVKKEENKADGTVTYSGRYQVQLVRRSSGIYITVLDEQEANAPVPVAEDLLWSLKDHLPAS